MAAARWNLVAMVMVVLALIGAAARAEPKAKAPKLSSSFTAIFPSKTCKALDPKESIPTLRCPTQRGYTVEVGFGGWETNLDVSSPGGFTSRFSGNLKGRLEWRLADGKPFAVILEVDTEQGRTKGDGSKPIQIQLRGLAGFEDLKVDLDKAPGALEKARLAADEVFRAHAATATPPKT